MKTIKELLEVYKPKSPDEQKFVDKHVTIKHKDRNGNGDDVFKADNIKTNKRKEERHGYDVGEDEKVYEALKGSQHKIDANKNGKVDAHDFHLLRKKKIKEESEIDALLDEALALLNSIDEKTLTPAEMKKREEVVKAIKRDDPNMDKSMAYAIATKTAKRVAEGTMPTADEPTDDNKKMAQKVRDLLAKEKKPVKEDVEDLDEDLSKLSKADLVNNYRKSKNALGNLGRTPYEDREDSGWDERVKHHKDVLDSHMAELKRREVKEEVQIDELSNKAVKTYVGNAYNDYVKKSANRMPGEDETDAMKKRNKSLALAHKKLANEETEDLEELSVAKLKDYRTKARADAYDADDVDDERRYRKRAAGSNTAGKKIVRQGGNLGEQAELDESAKIAAHLIKRYGDNVRKSHVVSAANDFGVDASKLAKAVRTKLGKSMLDEEQMSPAEHYKVDLPNILKDIRGKKKSHSDLRREYGGSWKRLANSTAGEHGHNYNRSHLLAVGKQHMDQHMQEEVQIDELSKDKLINYMDKASDARGHRSLPTKKVDNRYAGVKKASDKLAKEEVEAIDELSKNTMGSYIKKAATKMGSQGVTAGLKIAADEKSSKNFKDMGKREKGIATAVKKLTKEDIINRTIDKYMPEDYTPPSLDDQFMSRIDHLPEAHAVTLLGLFDGLNEENKSTMINTVATEEGLNSLLDFAIQNRGA